MWNESLKVFIDRYLLILQYFSKYDTLCLSCGKYAFQIDVCVMKIDHKNNMGYYGNK